MDIGPYVEHLRQDLVAAASAGGEDLRAAAERLVLLLEPSTRMALLEALSDAAAEITTELPAGAVEVRLHGRDPEFVVSAPPAASPEQPPAAATDDEDETLARITLRLPESVKTRAEQLAGRSGQSLNSWLVGAVRRATREHAVDVDIDLSSLSFLDRAIPGFSREPGRRNKRMTGWV